MLENQDVSLIQSFFKQILPSVGYYCLAMFKDNKYWVHKSFDNIDSLVLAATPIQNQNVFFAVGSLLEPKVWDKEKGKFSFRTHNNIGWFKSLIVDVDAGEKKFYKTQLEAILAIKNFCINLTIPAPTITSSGNGIHCYWVLSEDVSKSDWLRVSSKFKSVLISSKVAFDTTCTSDVARVLRAPGTNNCKTETKKKCEILKTSKNYQTLSFYEMLFDEAIKKNGLKAEGKKSSNLSFLNELSNTQEYPPKDQDLIIERCNQMKRAVSVGGTIGYEMRGHALSVFKTTYQQDYSSLHQNDQNERLCKQQNDLMLLDSITNNPHTCERIEATYGEGCKGCKWKGKIKSPANLGVFVRPNVEEVKVEEVKVEVKVEVKEEEVSINLKMVGETWKQGIPRFEPPKQYVIKNDGVWLNPQRDDSELIPMLVCPSKFYPYEVIVDEKNEHFINCYSKFGNEKSVELRLPLRIMASNTDICSEFCGNGILINSKQAGYIMGYLASYLKILKDKVEPTCQYDQLGWKFEDRVDEKPSKFVLPNYTITNNSNIKNIPSKKLNILSRTFAKKGTLQGWKDVANVYSREGYEGYAFTVCSGFGSVLMQFTELNGAIISMVGNSAAGKTSVLRVINAMWGEPDTYLTQSDTVNAFYSMIGLYSNICITCDELTDLSGERISNLAYAIGQGRAKIALDANRNIKDDDSSWKLLLVSTSNLSLLNKLTQYKKESGAEAYRIFELNVSSKNHKMSKSEAEKLFPKILDNYGHVGEIYVKCVLNNIDEIKRRIQEVRNDIDDLTNATAAERYWTIAMVVNLVGCEIANQLGLVDYDVEKLKEYAIDQMLKLRKSSAENTMNNIELLSAYLAETIGATFTVEGRGDKLSPFIARHEAMQRIWNRYEVDKNLMYIDKYQLKNFIVKNGADYNTLIQELVESRVIIQRDKVYQLSKGSYNSNTGNCSCLVLNMNHEDLAYLDDVKNKLKIVENSAKIANER